jgi:ubiquinone/menaquinone biosynthesis C-methylase UbiE
LADGAIPEAPSVRTTAHEWNPADYARHSRGQERWAREPARFPNLSFLEADASALPFHSEFDAVFSNAVLHWVLDH